MPLKIHTHWRQRRHCGSKRHITRGFHQLKMKRTRTTANTRNEALDIEAKTTEKTQPPPIYHMAKQEDLKRLKLLSRES